jgi:hypothetical protein
VDLQHSIRAANEAIAVDFFHAAPWVAWRATGNGDDEPVPDGEPTPPDHAPRENPSLEAFATATDPEAAPPTSAKPRRRRTAAAR